MSLPVGAFVSTLFLLGTPPTFRMTPYAVVKADIIRYVDTDMTKTIAATRPGLVEVFLSEPPMKRMADRVDLKGAAVFLLSDASAYMTSADMLITGGMHAGRA